MAYNQPYGYPFGAPNYYNNYGNYQQPQQPQQNQQMYYAIVNGLEGAKNYQVNANQSILLMDSNEPIAYKKSANGLGQTTIEAYKLVPINNEEQPKVEYVSKSEFDELARKFEALSKRLTPNTNQSKEVK